MAEKIVGVRFKDVGKVYHFDAIELQDVQPSDFVIVRTSRGKQLGEVVNIVKNPEPPSRGTWKKLIRKATAADLLLRQQRIQEEKKITEATIKIARAKSMSEGKIVITEINFDPDQLLDIDLVVNLEIIKRGSRNGRCFYIFPYHFVC